MRNKIEKIILLTFCIYSLFFIIGSTLAPILAHFQHYDISAKLTGTYMYSCHQQPDRSFWILGYPVALCARCLGFYTGVFSSTLISIFRPLKNNLLVIIFSIILVIADLYANFILKIDTGNGIRFLIGMLMGYIFTLTLCFIIKFIKEKITYER